MQALRLHVLPVALLLGMTGVFAAGQTTYLNEPFTGASASKWVFVTGQGTGAVLTASAAMPEAQRDAVGEGWLRLTHDLVNQSTFVYCTNQIATTNGLVFSFDFAIWTTGARSAADGFVLAIFNATNSPGAGGYGGSLGYAQRSGIDGLNGALVGFGFDAFGNFSNPTEGRVGGPGSRPNAIAVRGPMGTNRRSGYEYVFGSATLEAFYTENKQSRTNVVLHSARIAISPEKSVSVAWTDRNGAWQKLFWKHCDLPCPERVKIGFTAGTGASRANQEVRNLTVASYASTFKVWDGGSAVDAGWGIAANWVDDGLPGFSAETDLIFSAPASDRLHSFLGSSRVVRSLVFQTNTVGDVVLRTTSTADGAESANLVFRASGDGAAIMVPAGAGNNYLIGDGGGSLILSNNLLVAHHGAGNLTFGRPVAGPAGITKTGSGTLVFSNSNSYAGETVVMDGALRLSSGSTLGSSGSSLSVWGGSVNLGGTTQANGTVRLRGGALTNGTLSISSRFHYYGGTFAAALAGSGGVDKWESSTLTLTHSNRYSGATTVRAGTLLVNNSTGSGTGSGSVTIYNPGILGGNGTVGGTVTVASGGRVAPGAAAASVGTLKVGGNVTFQSGSTYEVGIGSDTACDKLDLLGTGTLTLGDGAILNIGTLTGEGRTIAVNIKRNGLTGAFKDTAGTLLADGSALPLQPTYYIHYVNKTDSDDGYIVLNTSPTSAEGIIRAYATPSGVVVEFQTTEEAGQNDIVLYLYRDGQWVEVGRQPAAGEGSHTYRFVVAGLNAGDIVNLLVLDDEGTARTANNVTVGGLVAPVTPGVLLYTPAATVSHFEAAASEGDGQVRVRWQTTVELGVETFRVLRQRNGGALEPVGPGYVRSQGDEAGGTYELADDLVTAGDSMRYELLITSPHGLDQPVADWAGIISTIPSPRQVPAATAAPVAASPAQSTLAQAWIGSGARVRNWTDSVPAERVRLSLREEGVYRVSAQELADASGWDVVAVTAAIASTSLSMSCQGAPVAWYADDTNLLFNGLPADSRFAPENVYWIAWGPGSNMSSRMMTPEMPATTNAWFMNRIIQQGTTYLARVSYSTLADSPAPYVAFPGPLLAGGAKSYSETLTDCAPGLWTGAVTVNLLSYYEVGTDDHAVRVSVGGTPVGEPAWSGEQYVSFTSPFSSTNLVGGIAALSLTNIATAPPLPATDYTRFLCMSYDFSYACLYRARNGALRCTGGTGNTVAVSGFASNDVVVLDVTVANQPAVVEPVTISYDGMAGNWVAAFPCGGSGQVYQVCSRSAGIRQPAVRGVRDVDWASPTNAADYVILVPPEDWREGFRAALQPLADFRAAQGLRTLIVDVESIYNRYSCGLVDPLAIRAFCGDGSTNWAQHPLRYLLLAGAGALDFKHQRLSVNDYTACLIPTLIAGQAFLTGEGMTVAMDGALGDADGDGVPEVAVGRLPTTKTQDLAVVVQKTIAYEGALVWKQQASIAADWDNTLVK